MKRSKFVEYSPVFSWRTSSCTTRLHLVY